MRYIPLTIFASAFLLISRLANIYRQDRQDARKHIEEMQKLRLSDKREMKLTGIAGAAITAKQKIKLVLGGASYRDSITSALDQKLSPRKRHGQTKIARQKTSAADPSAISVLRQLRKIGRNKESSTYES